MGEIVMNLDSEAHRAKMQSRYSKLSSGSPSPRQILEQMQSGASTDVGYDGEHRIVVGSTGLQYREKQRVPLLPYQRKEIFDALNHFVNDLDQLLEDECLLMQHTYRNFIHDVQSRPNNCVDCFGKVTIPPESIDQTSGRVNWKIQRRIVFKISKRESPPNVHFID
jgi:hypothetical protein